MPSHWKLNQDLDWRDVWAVVFPDLDPGTNSAALPLRLICPLCPPASAGRTFFICRDPVLGGHTFWCASCRAAGDMLQLVAAAWKLEIPAAIARLRQHGFSQLPERRSALTPYLLLREEQSRLLNLCERGQLSRMQNFQHNALRLLWKLCGLSHLPSPDRSPEVLSGWIATTASEIEAAFQPLAIDWERSYPDQTPSRSGSSGRLFRGRHWDEILAIPAWDLPGRVGSLLCIGREGLPRLDHVLAVVHYELRTDDGGFRKLGSTGLHYHPDAVLAAERYNRRYLVLPDMLTAASWQVRRLMQAESAWPLVGWPGHPKYDVGDHAWQPFWQFHPVFVCTDFSASFVAQAIRRDGDLVWAPEFQYLLEQQPDQLQAEHGISDPWELLENWLARSSPWPQSVSNFLCQADDRSVAEFLWGLSLHEVHPHDILPRLSEAARRRALDHLEPSVHRGTAQRSILIDRQMVYETAQGWFVQGPKGPEQICNACLVIERVICGLHPDNVFYWGRIRLPDQEIPFCAEKQEFDRDPFRWMERHLLRQGAGLLVYNPRWSSRAVLIAQQAHPPEVIQGVEPVGWSVRRMEFNFPNFRITRQGEVRPQLFYPYPVGTPAESLLEPSSSFWQWETLWLPYLDLCSCVLADLMGSLCGLPPRGGLIHGAQARAALELLAISLGNRIHRLIFRARKQSAVAREIQRLTEQHRWPVLVQAAARLPDQTAQSWLRRDASGWIICATDWWTAAASDLEGTRWSFAAEAQFPLPHNFQERERVGRLLVTAIQRMLATDCTLPADWSQRLRICRNQLGQCCGLPETSALFEEPALVRILKRFLADGILSAGRQGWCPEHTPVIYDEQGTVIVSRSAIRDAFSREQRLPPDLSRVATDLKVHGCTVQETATHWIFPDGRQSLGLT